MSSILNKFVARADNIAYRTVADEAVIMTPADSMLHELNEVATSIFANINGKRTVRELCKLAFNEYEVEMARLEADISTLIGELEKKNILQLSDAPIN